MKYGIIKCPEKFSNNQHIRFRGEGQKYIRLNVNLNFRVSVSNNRQCNFRLIPRLSSRRTTNGFSSEKEERRDSTYGNVRAKIHLLSIVPSSLGFIRACKGKPKNKEESDSFLPGSFSLLIYVTINNYSTPILINRILSFILNQYYFNSFFFSIQNINSTIVVIST